MVVPRANGVAFAGCCAVLAACTLTTPLDQLETASAASTASTGSGAAGAGASTTGSGGQASGGAAGSAGSPVDYARVVLADTPRAYWRLGESAPNAMAMDETGNHPGSYIQVTLGAPGAIGDGNTAAEFDGEGSYVTFGDVLDFESTSSFSLEAWVNPADGPLLYEVICAKDDDTIDPRQGYGMWRTPTQLGFERIRDSNVDTALAAAPPPGLFSHVVAVYDGTTMSVWVNGMQAMAEPASQVLKNHSAPFLIGATDIGGTGHFAGVIDEVAVYDYALSQNQIQAHHAAGVAQGD